MIGLKYWNENNYYTQTNNPTEEKYRKFIQEHELDIGFLETCGPTAVVNILAARGDNVEVKCPGKYKPQPEEVLTDWFHDPQNYPKIKQIIGNAKDIMSNRWARVYTIAVPDVFDKPCNFVDKISFSLIKEYLEKNIGIVVCLNDPAHYIPIGKCDPVAKMIAYNEPWPGNYWPKRLIGTSGFNRKVTYEELNENVKRFMLLIG